MLLVLRKLIRQMPELPPVAGTLLFNNLVWHNDIAMHHLT